MESINCAGVRKVALVNSGVSQQSVDGGTEKAREAKNSCVTEVIRIVAHVNAHNRKQKKITSRTIINRHAAD